MARIRTIKPELMTDARVMRWDDATRFFFIGLMVQADDSGRFRAEPAILAGAIWPGDLSREPRETLAKVSRALATLADDGRVEVYDDPTGSGEIYGEITHWAKHQRIDKPTASRIPPAPRVGAESRKSARQAIGSDAPGNASRGPREEVASPREDPSPGSWTMDHGSSSPTPPGPGREDDEDERPVGLRTPDPAAPPARPGNVVTFKPMPVAPVDGSDAELGDLITRWQDTSGDPRRAASIPAPAVVQTLAELRDQHGAAVVAEAIKTTVETAQRPSLKYLRKVCESMAAGPGSAPDRTDRTSATPRAAQPAYRAGFDIVDGEWRNGVYMSRAAHDAREEAEYRRAHPPTPEENAATIAQFDAVLAMLNAPIPSAAG